MSVRCCALCRLYGADTAVSAPWRLRACVKAYCRASVLGAECLHGRAGSLQAVGDVAVPRKQALHSLVRVNDLCMLPVEHPELAMPRHMLGKLRPLLVHGDGEPMKGADQGRYLQDTRTVKSQDGSPLACYRPGLGYSFCV